jgi:hypothetical protein
VSRNWNSSGARSSGGNSEICRGLFCLLISIHETFDMTTRDSYSRAFRGPLCMLSMELGLSSRESEEVSSLEAAGEMLSGVVSIRPRTNSSLIQTSSVGRDGKGG